MQKNNETSGTPNRHGEMLQIAEEFFGAELIRFRRLAGIHLIPQSKQRTAQRRQMLHGEVIFAINGQTHFQIQMALRPGPGKNSPLDQRKKKLLNLLCGSLLLVFISFPKFYFLSRSVMNLDCGYRLLFSRNQIGVACRKQMSLR